MKRLVLSIIGLSLTYGSAWAEPFDKTPVKLKLSEAFSLEQALARGFAGEPGPDGKVIPYKFEPNLTYSIAIDVSALEPVTAAFEKTRKEVLESIHKAHPEDFSPEIKPGSPSEMELLAKLGPLWETEQEFSLIRLHLPDFNIGAAVEKNHIPPMMLVPLAKILDPK